MGTIVITEIGDTGSGDDKDVQVPHGSAIATTRDASTSTTGVQVTTNGATKLLMVASFDGAHRIQVNTSASTGADSVFYPIPSGGVLAIGIRGGQNFAYRLDA